MGEFFFKSQSGEVLYKYYTKPEASKEKTDKFDYKKNFFFLQNKPPQATSIGKLHTGGKISLILITVGAQR